MQLWSIVLIVNVCLLSACSFQARAPLGTPHDLIAAVQPSRPGGAAPSFVTSTSITRPPSTATARETRLAIAAEVGARFRVVFREDGASWTDGEVTAVRDALALLDDRELAQIQHTTFVRKRATSTMIGGSPAQALHRVGVFTQASRPQLVQEVELSDSAVLLSRADLVAMIVHELGHVIERVPRNHARFAVMTAETERETQRADAWVVDRQFVKHYAAATARIDALSTADRELASELIAGLEASALAYAGLRDVPELAQADFDRARAQREATLSDALSRLDRARARLASTAPTHPALAGVAHTLTLQNKAVAAVRAWSHLRARAAAAVARFTAASAAGDISARLHAFIAEIGRHHIGPISNYTAKIMVLESSQFEVEMFAESFSLWKTDRPALQRAAPALTAWFDQGNHLK